MVALIQPVVTEEGANILEAVRYQLETVGFTEVTLTNKTAFTNSATQLMTIDGIDLGTSIPLPPDSMIYCTVMGAVYMGDANGTSDTGSGAYVTISGLRVGTGDVSNVLSSTDVAATNTVTVSENTTNQGIDITFQNDSDDENCFFVGRAKLVCAKRGGFPKPYNRE